MTEYRNIPSEHEGLWYNTRGLLLCQDPGSSSLQQRLIRPKETVHPCYGYADAEFVLSILGTVDHSLLQISFHSRSESLSQSNSPNYLKIRESFTACACVSTWWVGACAETTETRSIKSL